MVIYKCNCGDELIIADNSEKTRDIKRTWKDKHAAPLIEVSPKRKIADRGRSGIHGYIRIVTRKQRTQWM